ncbi:MAG: ATP-binding protein [Bacteroidales bacterium]|nr:ATP-binding protein [Bacteroidales bacterium]
MKIHRLKRRIEEGEGLHLDFKFEISDAPKIARSLVAFANTDGGSLLVGVKDNGVLRGIISEEEYYIVEMAASRYCKPEVNFNTKEWDVKGIKILEIVIPKGDKIPYKAPDKKGNFKAFIRVADENILASSVQMKVWIKEKSDKIIQFLGTEAEYILLGLLKENKTISLKQFQEKAQITKFKAEKILSDFIILGLAEIENRADDSYFHPKS